MDEMMMFRRNSMVDCTVDGVDVPDRVLCSIPGCRGRLKHDAIAGVECAACDLHDILMDDPLPPPPKDQATSRAAATTGICSGKR